MSVRRFVIGSIGAAVIAAGLAVSPTPAMAADIGDRKNAGERPGATRIPFQITSSLEAQVDVGTGNLLVSAQALSFPGVSGAEPFSFWYNSANDTTDNRFGRGWTVDLTEDIKVVENSDDSITYVGPTGLTGVFDKASGNDYDSPAGFKMDLVKTSSGWELTERASRQKSVFNSDGLLVSRFDRNDNEITVEDIDPVGSARTTKIQGAAGPSTARAIELATSGSGSTLRHANQNRASFISHASGLYLWKNGVGTDANFEYNSAGLLQRIRNDVNKYTDFTYDSQGRVTSVARYNANVTIGTPSVTRFAYPDGDTTLVADPNTNQSQGVANVPNTDYTLNNSDRVTDVVDPEGREQSRSYTPNFDTAAASSGNSSVSNSYGANDGDSLTSSTLGTGASNSFAYDNPSGPSQYLPSKGTDDAGNESTYTFNGAGNQLSSSNAMGAEAKVEYNDDGTPKSATSPNNGSNKTSYAYTNKQVTKITPVNGASLGVRDYTYDSFGRLKTSTNGRGVTATYSYNGMDQVTSINYGSGTTVTFTYDKQGRQTKRVDASGTTNFTYDVIGRMLTRSHSAGGGTVEYEYDLASRITASESAGSGRTTYTYDDSGKLTALEAPSGAGSGRTTVEFEVDDQGRRTGTWLNPNGDRTTWEARNKVFYDGSGRVDRVVADRGTGDSDYDRIVDTRYCYRFGTTPASGCEGGLATDRNKVAWTNDVVSDVSTEITYDAAGRVTDVNSSDNTDYEYSYNSSGNRLTANSQSLSFNDGNQLTNNGYAYDAAGNITAHPGAEVTDVTYTRADQLASVKKNNQTYNYTHAGGDNNELITQTTPEGTYSYVYGRTDAQGKAVIDSMSVTTSSGTVRSSVTNDPVTGQPLMLRAQGEGQALYIYDGAPGSPMSILGADEDEEIDLDYDPFGVPLTEEGANEPQNPYTFGATGIKDRTTGWVHYGYRYYDPKTGTFTQQDTLDAPLNPTNGNRYAYAGNDPINNVDPTGLWGWDDAWDSVTGFFNSDFMQFVNVMAECGGGVAAVAQPVAQASVVGGPYVQAGSVVVASAGACVGNMWWSQRYGTGLIG